MYEVTKNVILTKNYNLADILKKIDTLWMQGDLTDDQRVELIDLARSNAEPENSYADVQKQLDTIYTNMAEMAVKILAIEDRVTKLEGGTVEPPQPEEYPEYKPPTGAHDAYKAGDKITYRGTRYICVAPEGVAVVWSPDVMPSYWREVKA